MVYRAIGLMSGSSLDGLDIVFAELHENGGKWSYEILEADCYPYSPDWVARLTGATTLNALDYQLLHIEYGHYIGGQVNRFIEAHQLQYRVGLIASHGHTTFHLPSKRMTAQLGDGASIAGETQLPVVSDLRSMDMALDGQGAPIVPIGEKLLLEGYDLFLNLGGIANISFKGDPYTAFDICACNRVLNMLANEKGKEYDDAGKMAATGTTDKALLAKLDALDYYTLPFPKSLANEFGTQTVFPLIKSAGCSPEDGLHTCCEHVVTQIKNAILKKDETATGRKLLVTGGGAFNTFLLQLISKALEDLSIEVIVPDSKLVNYKEALIMSLIGVLRWREEVNVLSSVTGAREDSVGGAMWI